MSASANLGSVARPQTVERYFEVALYLMILSGFGTLAETGQLDPLTVLLVVAALVTHGYFLVRRYSFVLPQRWTQFVTLAFTLWYLVDFFLISGTFIAASVHLVLALMVVRLFSAHRNRDYVFLAILSFLLVLAASVLTVNSTFLFGLASFLLAAVATFILMEMRRSFALATMHAREVATTQQKLGLSLAGTVPALVLSILIAAAAIFFLLPRISAGYFSAYAPAGALSTGFSDHVQLGGIGQIQQSNSVVMHIQIGGDPRGTYDLKWRGISLAEFDGRNWSAIKGMFVLQPGPDGRFVLPPSGLHDPTLHQASSRRRTHSVHYRVLLEPIGSGVFFLASAPESLQGNYRMVAVNKGSDVFDIDSDHPINLYVASSNTAPPAPEELRAASDNYPTEALENYLRLPPLDPRIAPLARQITADASTNYDRAAAVERYLTTHFGYTLQLDSTSAKDPLAHFLFERKQGHCEYFASSMVVMLRTLHIPSRVVNGFRTGEFNDLTSQYVVRARDAHSWVEVYFPDYGWVSFDPTPAAILQTHIGFSRIMLYLDAMSSFWREWIINYDLNHQVILGREATRTTRQWFTRIQEWGRNDYATLLRSARQMRHRVVHSPRTWTVGGVLAIFLFALLINIRHAWLFVRSRRLAAYPHKWPQKAASIWYERMTRTMARRGWRKSPTQTPAEFVTTIDDPGLRQRVAQFTAHYENARFGQSSEDACRLPELYEEITTLEPG